MSQFQRARITRVKTNKQGKIFAFATVLDESGQPTQNELYLSLAQARFTLIKPIGVVFGSSVRRQPVPLPGGGTHLMELRQEMPSVGETIVFQPSTQEPKPGMKLEPVAWCHEDIYAESVKRLEDRRSSTNPKPLPWKQRPTEARQPAPEQPTYRVVKHATYYGKSETTTLWEGKNIMVMSAALPKRERFGRVSDTLTDGSADGGDMHWYHAFERQMPDGTWQPCDDPRVFVCCVPRDTYHQHGTGLGQDRCRHNTHH